MCCMLHITQEVDPQAHIQVHCETYNMAMQVIASQLLTLIITSSALENICSMYTRQGAICVPGTCVVANGSPVLFDRDRKREAEWKCNQRIYFCDLTQLKMLSKQAELNLAACSSYGLMWKTISNLSHTTEPYVYVGKAIARELDLLNNNGCGCMRSSPPVGGNITYSVPSLKACGLLSPILTRLLISFFSCLLVLCLPAQVATIFCFSCSTKPGQQAQPLQWWHMSQGCQH